MHTVLIQKITQHFSEHSESPVESEKILKSITLSIPFSEVTQLM